MAKSKPTRPTPAKRASRGSAQKKALRGSQPEFHTECQAILGELRRTLQATMEPALVGLIPGATEWGRALDIDTKLAWKLTHLMDPDSDLEALEFVPGRQAFDQVLESAMKLGGASDAQSSAKLAFERYETLVRTHAGSRKAFDVLVTSQRPRGRSRAEVNLRRSAVEANASLLGVRARAQVAIYGLAPSEDGQEIDVLGVRKIEGMERVRPNVNWRIARSFRAGDDGKPLPGAPVPLVDAKLPKALAGLALVPEFSSNPLPDLGRVESQNAMEFEMLGGEVGKSARFDLTTADIFRGGDSRYASESGDRLTRIFAAVRVPCDLLYMDLVVHHDLFKDTEPLVSVVSTLHTGMSMEFREPDRLPIEPEFAGLGRGFKKVEDRERGRHGELLRWSMHHMGWDPEEFDVYRLKLAYPPIPSAVSFDWTRSTAP